MVHTGGRATPPPVRGLPRPDVTGDPLSNRKTFGGIETSFTKGDDHFKERKDRNKQREISKEFDSIEVSS